MSEYDEHFEKAYLRAVKYVSYRARTSYELHVYLQRKEVPEHLIEKIVFRFKENFWLNDTDYARRFVEQAVKYKSKGKTWIRQALNKKGIETNLIQQVLQEVDDEHELAEAILFARKKWAIGYENNKHYTQKIFQALARRGYSIEIINKALRQLELEIESP